MKWNKLGPTNCPCGGCMKARINKDNRWYWIQSGKYYELTGEDSGDWTSNQRPLPIEVEAWIKLTEGA